MIPTNAQILLNNIPKKGHSFSLNYLKKSLSNSTTYSCLAEHLEEHLNTLLVLGIIKKEKSGYSVIGKPRALKKQIEVTVTEIGKEPYIKYFPDTPKGHREASKFLQQLRNEEDKKEYSPKWKEATLSVSIQTVTN